MEKITTTSTLDRNENFFGDSLGQVLDKAIWNFTKQKLNVSNAQSKQKLWNFFKQLSIIQLVNVCLVVVVSCMNT